MIAHGRVASAGGAGSFTGLWQQSSVCRYSFRVMWEAIYCGAVTTQMIILNGGSSSGKSGIVRCLQAVLPDPWMAFGCDSFIGAMPAKMQASDGGSFSRRMAG